jgi:ubiquinone/menaquinone biosynthesis C-methylase UbiE
MTERDIQHDYYRRTAQSYDAMHGGSDEEAIGLGLSLLVAVIGRYGYRSLLSVGSGTGRELLFVKRHHPGLRLVGIEPVEEMRRVGHEKGLSASELIDGDGGDLPFERNSFDIVIEVAALHHIRRHDLAVREMVRVARHAVFLIDVNNFGQGSGLQRGLKQLLHAVGLWPAAVWLRTRGRGYHYSEGDGIYYSYSVFGSVPQIRHKFPIIHYMNVEPVDSSYLYRSAPGVAVFARRAAQDWSEE